MNNLIMELLWVFVWLIDIVILTFLFIKFMGWIEK